MRKNHSQIDHNDASFIAETLAKTVKPCISAASVYITSIKYMHSHFQELDNIQALLIIQFHLLLKDERFHITIQNMPAAPCSYNWSIQFLF